MQSDDSWGLIFVEGAKDGIPRHLHQVVPVVPLSENAVTERPGVLSAIGRFSSLKYDLGRPHSVFLVLSQNSNSPGFRKFGSYQDAEV